VQVVAVEDPLLRDGRAPERRVDRVVLRGVAELLGEAVRQRPARGDRRGERAGALERRAVDDAADEAPRERPVGVDRPRR
jgi:hypothetical protein